MWAGTGRSDRGETLLELMIAIGIMSTAVLAVVGGLTTAVLMSDLHRQRATAGVALRNYAETINRTVDTVGYPSGCAALSVSFTPPTGFSASITKVGYWTGSTWSSTCSTDSGLRQLTLKVSSSDSRIVEQLVIEVRRPCGLADTLCN